MSIEKQLHALLAQRQQTFATAESCTGGLIAKRMTDVPGASGVFMGGVVCYTNLVKQQVLGVSSALLESDGAVSESVARAMAQGARRVCRAHYGISVTGVAGPDSDDRGNPVGTVFIAVAAAQDTSVYALHLSGDRAAIREQAADTAFAVLLDKVKQGKETNHGEK